MIEYKTTRNSNKLTGLKEAAFAGLAPDGGLFMPARIPQANLDEVRERADSSFADMAEYLAGLFFAGDVSRVELHRVTHEAFDFPVPLRRIGTSASNPNRNPENTSRELFTLELFHGPTAAFKDFGAGFMGKMLGLLRSDGEKLIILTATSGDTGSAVAHGFLGVPGIEVVVLYPDGKISNLQESQMTTLGGNIHALRVAGTFDDCQRMVKEVFGDSDFRKTHNVTSANSINLLRWLPQSFYYFWGVLQWQAAVGAKLCTGNTDTVQSNNTGGAFCATKPSVQLAFPEIVVPSGNYGNLSAGMLARRMGLPVKRFVAASNANDVVPEWLRTSNYRPRPSVLTVANAMDVGAPSNYERMVSMTGGDIETLRREIAGFASDDEAIRAGIRELYDRYGYISDPHSAAGYNAAKHYDTDGFWLSTAAPAKFGEVIEPVLGIAPEIPERLAKLLTRPKVSTPIAPDSALLKDFVASL